VTRRFGGLVAVSEVSLDLQSGEMVSIVGPNGAGKTTLFNLLTGQLRPTHGEVLFRGERITNRPAHRRALLGLGRTFQIVRPLGSLTVRENVMVGAYAKYRRRRPSLERAQVVLERVGLAPRADVLATSLTLAERKRLEVARALAGEPDILLLDEVMAGLNPAETDRAVEMIRGLNDDGLTILLIEHNLKVVRALAQRVLVLDHGAPIAHGAPDEVLANPEVVAAYLGVKHAS
jgi:branched-chain amino acid transport system ATP-binding protein